MISFQGRSSFVEVDDAVQEREDIGAEICDVTHCPVMGVEDSEEPVHPR